MKQSQEKYFIPLISLKTSKRKVKSGAFAHRALGTDIAAVFADDALDGCQPDTGAFEFGSRDRRK